MKFLLLFGLISPTHTVFAAPSHGHVVRQIAESNNEDLAVTLPVALAGDDDANAKTNENMIRVIDDWRMKIVAVNNFVNTASNQLQLPLSTRDISVIVNALPDAKKAAKDEPSLFEQLLTVTNDYDLTGEASNAVVSLRRELSGANADKFGLNLILERIGNLAKYTPLAKTEDEFSRLSTQEKQMQPDCTIKDQLKELNGNRCCVILPFITTIWSSLVYSAGLGLEVDLDVPEPDACKDQEVCVISTTLCGPQQYTTGYSFVPSQPAPA